MSSLPAPASTMHAAAVEPHEGLRRAVPADDRVERGVVERGLPVTVDVGGPERPGHPAHPVAQPVPPVAEELHVEIDLGTSARNSARPAELRDASSAAFSVPARCAGGHLVVAAAA